MNRRTFLGSFASACFFPFTLNFSYLIDKEIPFIEAAWRALPNGTLIELTETYKTGRWILIHPTSPDLVGSHRHAWGGAHGGASPWVSTKWKSPKQMGKAIIRAIGISEDEKSIRLAIDPFLTDQNEREWVKQVVNLRVNEL